MGSRLTPRLMRAPATSRRRARSVLVRSVIGRFFSFSCSTVWDAKGCQSGMPAQSNALKQGLGHHRARTATTSQVAVQDQSSMEDSSTALNDT